MIAPCCALCTADAHGNATLVVDLGCFTIRTNPSATTAMNADEVALYEAFVLQVDHVSAYLLDGPFAWPSNDMLAASGDGCAGSNAHPDGSTALRALLAQRSRVVSLLERFGAGADLQVATSVHPRCVSSSTADWGRCCSQASHTLVVCAVH